MAIYTFSDKGRVTLRVPYEFEVVLTVVGDDIMLPWRLLELRILVGEALPGMIIKWIKCSYNMTLLLSINIARGVEAASHAGHCSVNLVNVR